jgi:anti-anti-sigma factor
MFTQTKQGAVTVITGDEPLNGDNVSDANEVVLKCLSRGQPRLVFNLQKIPYVDSLGLNFLLDTRDVCNSRGGSFKIAAPNPLCRDILRITEIDRQVEIFPDVLSASGSFAQCH